jgi:hypothetical protein
VGCPDTKHKLKVPGRIYDAVNASVYIKGSTEALNEDLSSLTASVVYWSEFLATDSEVPGSIPVHYKKKSCRSGTGSTEPREHNSGATWEQ